MPKRNCLSVFLLSLVCNRCVLATYPSSNIDEYFDVFGILEVFYLLTQATMLRCILRCMSLLFNRSLLVTYPSNNIEVHFWCLWWETDVLRQLTQAALCGGGKERTFLKMRPCKERQLWKLWGYGRTLWRVLSKEKDHFESNTWTFLIVCDSNLWQKVIGWWTGKSC